MCTKATCLRSPSIAALVVGSSLAFAFAAPAVALPITYTVDVAGSGTLDGIPFTDAPIAFSLDGDTSNIVPNGPGEFINPPIGQGIPATVTVTQAGVQTTDTLTDFHVGVSQQNESQDLGNTAIFQNLLIISNPAFATYSLGAIGPTSGPAVATNPNPFPTVGGNFVLDELIGNGTFEATVGAPNEIPLPATLPLFASGLGALGLLGWRRKRRTPAVA